MVRQFVQDTWAALNFKTGVLPRAGRPPTAPTWVDDVDARRLAAYQLLGAYRSNCASNYLPDPPSRTLRQITQADLIGGGLTEPVDYRDKTREYGHAALLVVQARSLLLGDEQTIDLPDARDLPDDAPTAERTLAERAGVFRDWLEGWADQEMLRLALHGLEENAVGDGDGVLALGWDPDRRRPRLRRYDPGFYFPDLTDDELDWPQTVHVAWEIVDRDGVGWLRRQTWRLVDVAAYRPRYAEPDEDPATRTCLYSDGRWRLDRLRDSATVYTLPDQGAEWRVRDEDQQVDFLPVVHVPNTPDSDGHFGRSILLSVAQVLDDLSRTDTDLQSASEVTGSAPLVQSAGAQNLPGGPGAVWTGTDARYLDTSRNLDAGLKYDEHLLDVLSVNSRLAAALLGRIKPNEVPSGYALELGFAATRNLIREMRLVRDAKYGLLAKMTLRLAQQHGELPDGPTPRAGVTLGSFLPADKTATVDRLQKLLPVHGISVRTAVQELIEVGYPIDDAEAEVDRILSEWGQLAVEAVDATGDPNDGRRILGLDPVGPLGLPAPVVNGQPAPA